MEGKGGCLDHIIYGFRLDACFSFSLCVIFVIESDILVWRVISEHVSSCFCTKCPCGNRNRREVSLLARQVNRECLTLGKVKII